jgi:restriction system protein
MLALVLSNLFRLRWWLPPLALALLVVSHAHWIPALAARLPSFGGIAPGIEQLAPYALRSLYALVPLTLLAAFRPWRAEQFNRSAELEHLSPRVLQGRLAETFRACGYAVHVRSLDVNGPDLLLSRDGERMLVQCRHWSRREVDTDQLRALCGQVSREKASGALLLTRARFSVEAMRFLRDVPIVVIDERGLRDLLEAGADAVGRAHAVFSRRSLASTGV